jgi:hypothetical protein
MPPHLKFLPASSNHDDRSHGICFMDQLVTQSSDFPYDLQHTLYDKRRSEMFQHVKMHYYTHGTTFLATHQIGVGTVTSQFHRFRRIITVEQNFCIELAIVLIKLVRLCSVPREPLIVKLRTLLNKHPYRYGRSHNTIHPTSPMAIFKHIMHLFHTHVNERQHIQMLINLTPQIEQEEQRRGRSCFLDGDEPAASTCAAWCEHFGAPGRPTIGHHRYLADNDLE